MNILALSLVFKAKLSEEQLKTLHAYKRSLLEKKQAELQDRCRRALEAEDDKLSCPKRDVTPVWRLYIADSKTESNRGVFSVFSLFYINLLLIVDLFFLFCSSLSVESLATLLRSSVFIEGRLSIQGL